MTRGRRIRLLRDAQGLEGQELARRAQINPTTLSNWEVDRHAPQADNMDALAHALRVRRDALDDDDVCVREIARLCGVRLPDDVDTETAALLASVPPERRAAVRDLVRGMVQLGGTSPPHASPARHETAAASGGPHGGGRRSR